MPEKAVKEKPLALSIETLFIAKEVIRFARTLVMGSKLVREIKTEEGWVAVSEKDFHRKAEETRKALLAKYSSPVQEKALVVDLVPAPAVDESLEGAESLAIKEGEKLEE